ncbi:hypothetical protein QUB80_16515 [Chlorogloeopsis sp. ULAP01]|uniref:hypothetical protein n=1 Tax=Chlorogloeopsis sp. ULAP01 TaxID=3056483 RepID=UPI0025AAAA6D|nr:hypothetical protein [Chlorogloeopsis sp. ULAP01]MDM9382309.1 hypothetical protein [Chlorogloeopsis sp. ULAP01]
MNTKIKIAFSCYLVAILSIACIALTYLFTPQLLPYQEQAVGVNWSEIEHGFQMQFLSLMKVSGGGYLSVAAALAVLLFIPFKKGENWARLAIPAIGIPAITLVNYAGLIIIWNTPGRPPVFLGLVIDFFFIAGLILSSGMNTVTAVKLSEQVETQL